MHVIWKGQFRFQLIAAPVKGEQVSINIDSPKVEIKTGNGPAFLIEGPGEYEVKDIFLQGIFSSSQNTIYTIEAEGIRLCYLGNFDQKELTPNQLDKLGDIDILIVPARMAKIVSQIEPRMVIPMGEGINKFLKEMGRKSVQTQPKLLIKKKDLPEEMKIVALKP